MIYFYDIDDEKKMKYEFGGWFVKEYMDFINTLMDMNGIPFHMGEFASYDVDLRQDLEIGIDFKKVFTISNRPAMIKWALDNWDDEWCWEGLNKHWKKEIMYMIESGYYDDGEQGLGIYKQITDVLKGNQN